MCSVCPHKKPNPTPLTVYLFVFYLFFKIYRMGWEMDFDMASFILFYLVGPTMGFTNFRFGQCSCHLSLSNKVYYMLLFGQKLCLDFSCSILAHWNRPSSQWQYARWRTPTYLLTRCTSILKIFTNLLSLFANIIFPNLLITIPILCKPHQNIWLVRFS